MMSSPDIETPRPRPIFFEASQTFSTKKQRGSTPRDCGPPRPPIKSAPPVSRIFPRKQLLTAAPVTFKSPEKSILNDQLYNRSCKDLYFEQCFDIISRLGVGSFGEAFKVRSKEDGRLYAVKRSRQRFRGESDRHRRFEEVVKHEILPSHPNCVEFVKAWEEKQYLYIQTELCKTSLSSFAEKNHDISERLIWNYLVDLLMAVKHLHDHDLVHMDIKPENIFISADNVCKLGDFGLVIDLNKEVEILEAQEGDPKYLAPELMLGKFGKPADIFSIGITIFELASDLDLPKGGDLWHELRSGRLPEQFLNGISLELQEMIRLMMEPDPAIRATVDNLLAHEYISKIWMERRQRRLIEHVNGTSHEVNGTHDKHSPVKLNELEDHESPFKRPSDWDKSSDDEDHMQFTGSPFSSPMGIPLSSSVSPSSDTENGLNSISELPRLKLFAQKAATSPGYRSLYAGKFINLSESPSPGGPVATIAVDSWDMSPTNSNTTSLSESAPNSSLRSTSPGGLPVMRLSSVFADAAKDDSAEPPTPDDTRTKTRSSLKSRNKNSCGKCVSVVSSVSKVRFNPVERKNLLKAFETADQDEL